jgi:lipid II:glycine glycyltransferase (peptidoglycan interpeptide bridge formation enzyme)
MRITIFCYPAGDMFSKSWLESQRQLAVHFLQTRPWAEFQAALGREVFAAHGEGWSWLAILERGGHTTRLYCPYGPTVAEARHLKDAVAALTRHADQRVDFVRIEPCGPVTARDCEELGLQRSHRNVQPEHTWVADLTRSEHDLLAAMSPTNRNLYRTAAQKGLSRRESSDPGDIDVFLEMIHEVAERRMFTPHPDHYYRVMAQTLLPLGAAKIYLAEHQGDPVNASIVFDSPTTRYYVHAGSYARARKLHSGNPFLATIILDGKAAGKQSFDFFGVAPPGQPDHPWAGLTSFKQSFGGHRLDRVGTWELACAPGS